MIYENAFNKKYKVIENTFPEYPGIAHALPGDIVFWCQRSMLQMVLVRESDDRVVFSPPRRKNQYSSFNFQFVGVVWENKSKEWRLVIEEIKEEILCR